MDNHYSNEELEMLIRTSNYREHTGRVERLRMLTAVQDLDPVPISSLASAYYEEARLCWCMGAHVAAIVMSQLSFEE